MVLDLNLKKNLLILDVRLNNQTKKFLFDTGSELSYLILTRESKKNRIKLPNTYLLSSVGGTKKIEHGFKIKKISIGQFELEDIFLLEMKKSVFTRTLNIDGIIGWDILKQFDFKLDILRKKLILKKRLKIKENTQSSFEGINTRLPIYNFYSNNLNKKLLIDTGSNQSYAYNRLLTNNYSKKKSLVLGMNGFSLLTTYYIDEFYFRASKHSNDYYILKNLELEDTDRKYDLLLGMDFLRNKILYFDNHNYMLEIVVD